MPVARSRSEQDGINIIEESLLLAPTSKGGIPCVKRATKANLSAHFLPTATSFVAKNLRLKTPQPDHYFGYIPSKKARPARLKAPFTIKEENIINRYKHCTLCPLSHLQLWLASLAMANTLTYYYADSR